MCVILLIILEMVKIYSILNSILQLLHQHHLIFYQQPSLYLKFLKLLFFFTYLHSISKLYSASFQFSHLPLLMAFLELAQLYYTLSKLSLLKIPILLQLQSDRYSHIIIRNYTSQQFFHILLTYPSRSMISWLLTSIKLDHQSHLLGIMPTLLT